jgi:polyphenol oxidase
LSELHAIPGLLLPDWPAPIRVKALTTTRMIDGFSKAPFDQFNLGDHVGDERAAVAANRAKLCDKLGLFDAPRWLKQVHGTGVIELPNSHRAEADASYTHHPEQVCTILTADCLPILLAAYDGSEVAAIHAGWRGLAAGVIEACIAKLRTRPVDLLAWFGPAIGPGAYEVGPDVRNVFVQHAREAEMAFRAASNDRFLADLYFLARLRLQAVGVRSIYGGHLCTFSDPQRFYSYRRDGASTGRMASMIWLTDT